MKAAILEPFSLTQRMMFFALCVLAVALGAAKTGKPSVALQALALSGILIAVWHGAFDGVLARPLLRPRFGSRWIPAFALGYLLLGTIVAALWWRAPRIALPLFLSYSAWHFGTEGTDWQPTPLSSAAALCQGFVPIAASCYWHPVEVSQLFSFMLRGSGSLGPRLTHVGALALWPLCVAISGYSLFQFRKRTGVLLLTGLELLLFWRADPLIAFAIFFCCWHTPEHLATSSASRSGQVSLRTMKLQLRSGLGPWLVSIIFLGLLLATETHRIIAAASSVFLLLSALTVPHMLLNEMRRRTDPRCSIARKEAHAS